MNTETANNDPNRFFWYGVFMVITIVSALPLFGARLSNLDINYLLLLFIHEFAAFLFFGHTFFSNIWAMQIRFNQSKEAGIWARGFLRKLAMSVTLTTSIIIPISGLMLIESWGGGMGAEQMFDLGDDETAPKLPDMEAEAPPAMSDFGEP